ncbi:MAG: hypothetical protein HS104_29075 [Polyangiaceae bacterium]|nr:hypothetical protein [Polyangiaceae bacterium]
MSAFRRAVVVTCLASGFLACSSTSTNEGPNAKGGSAGSGASSGSGGAPSGGAPSGGAPSGGAPSGGAPSGGAPSGGAAGGPGSGGGTSDAGCAGVCNVLTVCCASLVEGDLAPIHAAADAQGVCDAGSPCETPCDELCKNPSVEAVSKCVLCMGAQSIPLDCGAGTSCVTFKDCLGPDCAPK